MRQLVLDPSYTRDRVYGGVDRLLVCGTRTFPREKRELIREELRCCDRNTLVIHGAQGVFDRTGVCVSGADMLADEIARELGLRTHSEPAECDGPRRNQRMIDMRPDLVLAFWNGESPGTLDTLRRARRAGISVRVVDIF